jgi:hypothetical protein
MSLLAAREAGKYNFIYQGTSLPYKAKLRNMGEWILGKHLALSAI